MVADFIEEIVPVNGKLVHALRSDNNAKSFLQAVGVDELPFTRVHNTPCTLVSLAADWIGSSPAYYLKKFLPTFRLLGAYRIEDYQKAEQYLHELGLKAYQHKGIYARGKQSEFISYRVLLLLTLSAQSPRGSLLRDNMGIKTTDVPMLFKIGNVNQKANIEPAVVQGVEPEIDFRITLGEALRTDANALFAMKPIRVETLRFLDIQGGKYTLPKTLASWLGLEDLHRQVSSSKIILNRFGLFSFDNYEQAYPFIAALVEKPQLYKSAFIGGKPPVFISARSALLLIMSSNTQQGQKMRNLFGLKTDRIEGLAALVEFRETEEPKQDQKPEPPKSDVDTVTGFTLDQVDEMYEFFKDTDWITNTIQNYQPEIDKINSEIAVLTEKRDRLQFVIDRLLLLGVN